MCFRKENRLAGIAVALLLTVLASPAAAQQAAAPEVTILTFSRIDRAWELSQGEGVKVAVVDWFFDMGPESSKKYVDAVSLVPKDPIGAGDPWHGEWMAELVHQVAPRAKILPIRARSFDDEQKRDANHRAAYEKYLFQGIRYAADHGAVAVTSSMGEVLQCDELKAAVDYAEKKGTLFIDVHPECLSFDGGRCIPCKPGECDERILHTGLVSVPDYPTKPQPGRQIYVWPYQTDPVFRDGWGYSNGPPVVGGVVALLKSVHPELSPADVRRILVETARDEDGFAVLDAEAAVKKALELNSPAAGADERGPRPKSGCP